MFGEPQVLDYPFPGKEGTALSAVCFLGESSITVHTYPEYDFIFLDVFHCESFDAKAVLDWVKKTLGISHPLSFLLERGVDNLGKPMVTRPLVWSTYV